MFDNSSEQGEVLDSDSQNSNRSQVIQLKEMEYLEQENLSENQQLSNSRISFQQNNNQIKKFILNINLILTLSYIFQIVFGIGLCLAQNPMMGDSFQCEYNQQNFQIENCYIQNLLNSIIYIIIFLSVLIAVRFLKCLWNCQFMLVIYVSILFIILNDLIWCLLFSIFSLYLKQFQDYKNSGKIQYDKSYKLTLLRQLKISLAHLYFYFNFQLGIILLQTHITYQMSTNKQINLIFTNFIVCILCGCSVIFLPSYTIISFYYKDQLTKSQLIDPYPWQWRWEGFLINPIVFSIYTFLYIRSVKQIQNGKFQLRDDQKYIGALLTFINMFI